MHLFRVYLLKIVLLIVVWDINLNESFLFPSPISWTNSQNAIFFSNPINLRQIRPKSRKIFSSLSKALDEPMLDDFNKILLSLKIYSQINSKSDQKLRIPLKFEVPFNLDWPEYLHGFPLGKRLKRLVLSEKFRTQSPDKVKLIENHGFFLDINNILTEWDIIYEALVSYKNIYGDLNVDNDFVVPSSSSSEADLWPMVTHGLRLGSRVCAIRNSGAHVRVDNDRKKALDNLGFLWNKPKKEKKSGEDPVGEDSEELNLPSNNRNSDEKFNLFLEALISYKTLNGDLAIPTSYVIPRDSDQYPEHLWDFKLGNRVSLIRSQGLFVSSFPDRRKILDDMGFLWESPLKKKKKNILEDSNRFQDQSLTHKLDDIDKEGISFSSSYDMIDSDDQSDQFPILKNFFQFEKEKDKEELNNKHQVPIEKVFDLRLFYPTNLTMDQYHIDSNTDQVQYREEISKKLLVAINKYNDISDDFFPINDIKPMLSAIPPPTFKGIRILRYLKHRIYEYDNFFFEDVYEALYYYKQIFGHLDIPKDFVLTESFLLENPFINIDFKGMKLGEYIESLRNGDFEGKYHRDRRVYLDSIGFDWGDGEKHLRFPFYPFFLALKMYHYLFADATPPDDYIIPDEDPWPHCLVGCPLGKWTSYARLQKDILAKYYPERVQILDALGFIWWIPANFQLTEELE